MTLTGGGRSYPSTTGEADGREYCFSVDSVPEAGEYEDCREPSKTLKQSFELEVVSTAQRGARRLDDARVARPKRWGVAIHTIERTVEEIEEKPEECEELAANWTWTFASGVLECKKLPFPVKLPGFAAAVQLEELDSGTLLITGAETFDQLRLKPAGVRVFDDREFETYLGHQSLPSSMGFGGDLKADYVLYVTSSELLEGNLDLEKKPYRDDICSIFWPFSMRPIVEDP